MITTYTFRIRKNCKSCEFRCKFPFCFCFDDNVNLINLYLYTLKKSRTDKSDSQYDSPLSDVEVVIGNGQRCLPHDGNHCGDGRLGPDAQLIFPKGLAFALDGTLFFADGNLIRVLDTTGHVHRIVGHWNRKQWKPTTCKTSQLANEVRLIYLNYYIIFLYKNYNTFLHFHLFLVQGTLADKSFD